MGEEQELEQRGMQGDGKGEDAGREERERKKERE